ncbi:MAG TPA: molybdopterin-guanine dinucleotide biosynthesis protein B [Hydrogenophaga sp.]|uniref:molybdopterin-guanine dinucleotide biosynthesis protein B n=1 Tax=Hydrogenophaga sp. TaxID=1904254 RepID=UPI002BE0FE99|nr:molybdopterin-guanine dinucleotide biosynthesis protein B [Hydrogenophaga sp.]HMN91824.1 molybdopterin-guanine dinucleotide biosynthesis protein B [Hydrogenophaga sp.]HMP10737.1 molybdopterin-guanine dinucleotide biosynthesis protein B [Hydrogenophaga sp.]
MKVVVLAGNSGSGKTTLIEGLIPALRSRGLRVSVLKHAHHGLEVDPPGKDSWRHREAGAYEVLAVSPERLVLQRTFEQPGERSVHDVLTAFHPGVDWVLVEGWRDSNLHKIEVWRASTATAVRYPDDPFVAAIALPAEDRLPQDTLRPQLDLGDADAVAAWLVDNGERFDYNPEAYR